MKINSARAFRLVIDVPEQVLFKCLGLAGANLVKEVGARIR